MQPKPNYDREMQSCLAALNAEERPRLLLHACCGPCSSAVLEQLCQRFAVTVLYYNPNIWPAAEHDRRRDELARFLQQCGCGAQLVAPPYAPEEFYSAVQGLEAEPERGGRCTVCYRLRMEQAARYAAEHGFDWFCSTLSISPRKDAEKINAIGRELEKKYGVRHLPNEFKRKEGHKRSLELSAQYGLYRQDWCGCEFSARGSAPKTEEAAPAK